jgi:hypothetical protein
MHALQTEVHWRFSNTVIYHAATAARASLLRLLPPGEPRCSVSRSTFARVDDRDRLCFGRDNENEDQIGYLGDNTKTIFGGSYAAEPDQGCHWCHRSFPCKIAWYPKGRIRLTQRFCTGRVTTGKRNDRC